MPKIIPELRASMIAAAGSDSRTDPLCRTEDGFEKIRPVLQIILC